MGGQGGTRGPFFEKCPTAGPSFSVSWQNRSSFRRPVLIKPSGDTPERASMKTLTAAEGTERVATGSNRTHSTLARSFDAGGNSRERKQSATAPGRRLS